VKCIVVGVHILNYAGAIVAVAGGAPIEPRRGFRHLAPHDSARFCVVTLRSGNPKDARVSIGVLDGSDDLIAVMAAPSK
jgi:hypothetical protein